MKRIVALFALTLLAACSSVPNITARLTPFRIDVRQGNFVTQEMVAKLKAGQTKDQVRFILGTPLVTDMFHADQWDYVYRFEPGHGQAQERHVVVYFKDDKLARIGGDVVAAKPGAISSQPEQDKMRVIDIAPAAGAAAKQPEDKAGNAKQP